MKKRITLMTAVFALLAMLALPNGMKGQTRATQTINWVAADQGYTNQQEITEVVFDDNVYANFAKGSNNNAPKYYTTGSAIRCYGGNTIEFHSSYTLIEIAFTFASGEGTNAITADDGEYDNGTWTGNSTMVTFTIGGTSGHRRIASISITYNMGGAIPPRIEAEDVNIAYDATSGVIDYNIEYSVTGGVLTASSTADWIEFGDTDNVNYTVPFTCSANPNALTRTASVTLTYTYNTDQTVTKTIAVTQDGDPNATMTIAEVRAQGTGAVATKGIVTAISSNNNGTTAYIQDETAAVVVYGNFSAAVGDEIRAEGTLTTYKGLLEIGSPTITVLSQNNTVDPTPMTIEAINADAAGSNAYQAMLVRIEDATVNAIGSNNTIAQGDNTITVYGSLGDAAVNDVVSFTGNIGCYTSVQIVNPTDITIQQSEEPAILVGSLTVNVPYTATDGTLNVTYENITEIVAEIMYCDEDGIEDDSYDWFTAEIDENNNVYYLVDDNDGEARTGYFMVYALDDNTETVYSDIITINQAEYVAPALDYATLPFEFDGGRADIENTDGLTQEGIDTDYNSSPKLKFNTTGDWLLLHFNETPGKLTFNIKGNSFSGGTFTVQTSEDGEAFTDLASYTELTGTTIYDEEFNALGENVRYIKWIYTAKVSGNVALGNIVLEQPSNDPFIVVDPDTVNEDANEHDGTLSLAYANLEIGAMGDFDIQYYDAEGEEASTPDWIEITVAEQDPTIGEGYVVSYFMLENEGEARTAYFKVLAVGDDDFVYSNLVTISQEAYVAPVETTTYTLANNIISGKTYIISDGIDRAMGAQNGDVRSAAAVTIEGDVATVNNADVYEFVISGSETDGYTIYDAKYPGYLYASSSSKNNIGTREDNSDANGVWSIVFDQETGGVTITATGTNTRNTLRYNYNNGNDRFSCYGSNSTLSPILYLYVKEETPETYTLTVDGYTAGSAGGYQLIASPVTVNPANVEGMTTGSYDLYAFDQAEEQEWRNYRAEHFNLVPGKGYLYAKQGANQTFEFTLTGIPYNNLPIRLAKAEGGDFPGWNLVGNPYGTTAYIDRDYYVMNADGDDFIAGEGNAIEPMQGFFVIAENDGETLNITTEAPANTGSKIVVNVNGNNGNVMDRAIVRVENGNRLPKLMLNPNNTKLYIPQDGDEFSVVRSQRSGRLPIVFKPAEDGDYSFSVNTENLNMRYLHLIDHETGEDVDLLRNPEYRFTAKTNNKPNRFELEFKTGLKNFKELPFGAIKDERFAYYSNGEIVINGEGTLQVFDVNGRLVKSEAINGDARIQVKATAGIYMMQLITNDAVKTQKIVLE